MASHYLSTLFEPSSIAVIGASARETSVGRRVFKNLLSAGFNGKIHAVNPKHTSVLSKPCVASILDIKDHVDLAVIATPAKTIPNIITQCGKKGVPNAIIMSSGFSETGEVGQAFEQHILNVAKGYHIRIVGPNCLGLMRPQVRLNATFDNNFSLPGHLAFVSQSGALTAGILDWAIDKKIGFSALVSLGNGLDIGFADVLDYLAVDQQTKGILLYIEGIHHSRSFMSALRATARMKPVIAIKAGRHSLGSRAAISHTGALIGGDDVFDVALRRAGAVRVMTIEELFLAAEILSTNRRVKGDRLVIITNGGGAGVMAADRAADLNIQLPELNDEIIQELNQVLPQQWSHQNPIDIIGDATPDRYHDVLNLCIKNEEVDGILTMLVPVAMTNPLKVAEQIVNDSKISTKPIIACWMGEKQVKSSWNLFVNNKIPYFDTPEKAVQAFSYLADYHLNQQLLLQVPGPLSPQPKPDIRLAQSIINNVIKENRANLTAAECRNILKAFSIPVTEIKEAATKEEAVNLANALGFPLVMKINSSDVTHKKDVGGVILNINNIQEVQAAFDDIMQNVTASLPKANISGVTLEPMCKNQNDRELLIGVIRDIVFGPVISFGAGGSLVEIIKDRSIALPPLNQFIAEKMIKQTRISKWLDNFRGMPAVNINLIVNILLRISEMVCELPFIKEMDINPLIINDKNAVVVDARIIIDPKFQLIKRYSHMAIHPYPNNLISNYLIDETSVNIRPVRPEDAFMIQEFVRNLSSQSKYFRFMQHIRELTPDALVRLTQIDYDREMTFIATYESNQKEICIGAAHYVTNPDRESCEFAIVIADDWQNKGIGSRLMKALSFEAKEQGLSSIMGVVISTNSNMLEMVQRLGFVISDNKDPTIKVVTKHLS